MQIKTADMIMSQMQELFEKVSKDAALQEKFSAIMKDAEKTGEDTTKEKLVAFAQEAGYDVTLEEMQDFFKTLIEGSQEQLSEMELDMVAGGKGGGTDLNFGHATVIATSVLGEVLGGGQVAQIGCGLGFMAVDEAMR